LQGDAQEAGDGRKRVALVGQEQGAGPPEDSGREGADGREVLWVVALEISQL